MIQLTTSGVRIARDDAWAAQQQEFAQRHCVVLEGFLDESILCHIPRMLEHGEFDLRDHFDYEGQAFARELAMRKSEALPQMLFYFLNQPRLREAIAELTGCEKTIRTFVGRCFKHLPGGGQFDSWHGDVRDERLYALSINLSKEPFEGGSFQIRSSRTREVFQTVGADRLGTPACSAFTTPWSTGFFRYGEPLRGTAPRYRYAGCPCAGSLSEIVSQSALFPLGRDQAVPRKDPA